jgi:hypothetical protein
MMKKQPLPKGWTQKKIQNVLSHYESQAEDEAVAEDEAAFSEQESVITVPVELLPKVRKMLAKYKQQIK